MTELLIEGMVYEVVEEMIEGVRGNGRGGSGGGGRRGVSRVVEGRSSRGVVEEVNG